MDIANIKKQVHAIELGKDNDEKSHCLEDSLYIEFIDYIAEGEFGE